MLSSSLWIVINRWLPVCPGYKYCFTKYPYIYACFFSNLSSYFLKFCSKITKTFYSHSLDKTQSVLFFLIFFQLYRHNVTLYFIISLLNDIHIYFFGIDN